MWGIQDNHYGDNESNAGFDGGFMPNSSNTTANDGAKSKSYRGKQSVVSVVIKQIMNCKTDEFTIWGCTPLYVKIIGILEKMDVETTMIRYRIADHTDTITGMVTLCDSTNDKDDVNRGLQVVENTYVKIIGTISVIDGRKTIIVLNIKPLTDYNEYISHILESIFIRYSLEKKSQEKNSIDSRIRASGTDLGNSIYNFNNPSSEITKSAYSDYSNNDTEAQSLSNFQKKVFQQIRDCKESSGAYSQDIKKKFPASDYREVDSTLELLLSLGFIYTTMDEEHFRATNE